jgi:hypothetical protein
MIQVYVDQNKGRRCSTRHNSCARKVRYATEDEANRRAEQMNRDNNEDLESYSCPYCCGFHIGHKVPVWCRAEENK